MLGRAICVDALPESEEGLAKASLSITQKLREYEQGFGPAKSDAHSAGRLLCVMMEGLRLEGFKIVKADGAPATQITFQHYFTCVGAD